MQPGSKILEAFSCERQLYCLPFQTVCPRWKLVLSAESLLRAGRVLACPKHQQGWLSPSAWLLLCSSLLLVLRHDVQTGRLCMSADKYFRPAGSVVAPLKVHYFVVINCPTASLQPITTSNRLSMSLAMQAKAGKPLALHQAPSTIDHEY